MIKDTLIGKVYDYNGQIGNIMSDNNTYKFSRNDASGQIDNGDLVEFIPNTLIFGTEQIMVAKFIKPYNQKKLKKYIQE